LGLSRIWIALSLASCLSGCGNRKQDPAPPAVSVVVPTGAPNATGAMAGGRTPAPTAAGAMPDTESEDPDEAPAIPMPPPAADAGGVTL
jgi:hypothetical protein